MEAGMKRRALGLSGLVLSILFTLVIASACSGGEASEIKAVAAGTKPRVVATTVQITALTREVGGTNIELTGIVPAGADPHEFEPTASDLTKVEGANLILRHGLGLDDWLEDTLKAGKNAGVVVVTKDIKPLQGEEDGEKIEDPHVWHDPENDKIMIKNIADALERVDPANKATYAANAANYAKKLDETKAKVKAIIDEIPAANRKLVTDHDAFGYFAKAFGLEIVGAVIPSVSTQAEPSAADTADLLDVIKKEGVKAIFAEETVNPALARTLANDAKVKVVDDLYGDSLGQPGSGADTVDGMLLVNARKIADALK
jgi:ABC-type Zn uptake system ZnuABC Zn-binding protein ZnuA